MDKKLECPLSITLTQIADISAQHNSRLFVEQKRGGGVLPSVQVKFGSRGVADCLLDDEGIHRIAAKRFVSKWFTTRWLSRRDAHNVTIPGSVQLTPASLTRVQVGALLGAHKKETGE